ncbi:helix-turn-helix domain-containing protein [Trueperella pyogenes]|uniref:helix-turn-helix domain-containing protein n=1 Tax=Trueperella pyogenes TaxID=1661 RepID=UPI00345D4DE3
MGSLNAEIRAEMGRQRMSYARLARSTGQSRQSVQRKLTAERAVSIGDLEIYSNALGVPAWKFLETAQKQQQPVETNTKVVA